MLNTVRSGGLRRLKALCELRWYGRRQRLGTKFLLCYKEHKQLFNLHLHGVYFLTTYNILIIEYFIIPHFYAYFPSAKQNFPMSLSITPSRAQSGLCYSYKVNASRGGEQISQLRFHQTDLVEKNEL